MRRPRRARSPVVALVAGLACAGTFASVAASERVAYAQNAADVATARDLFREGMELRAKGKLPEALAKLAAAHALYQTPASALELARAQIDSGKLAEGYETLLSIDRIPAANESSRSKGARVEAKLLADKTNARIPTLRIDVTGASAQTSVTLDGEPVPPALFGVARKVDPGHHVVVAHGAAADERRVEVDVTERQAAVASIQAPSEMLAVLGGVASEGLGLRSSQALPLQAQPFSVLYKFLPPATNERWTLRGPNRRVLCALPCERWIGEHSGEYLIRAPMADDQVARRVDLSETLPATIGSTVTARPHAGRGTSAVGVLGGVFGTLGVLGLIGGASTALVGGIDAANETQGHQGADVLVVAAVMAGVSVVLLVSGLVLMHHNYAPRIDYAVSP